METISDKCLDFHDSTSQCGRTGIFFSCPLGYNFMVVEAPAKSIYQNNLRAYESGSQTVLEFKGNNSKVENLSYPFSPCKGKLSSVASMRVLPRGIIICLSFLPYCKVERIKYFVCSDRKKAQLKSVPSFSKNGKKPRRA